MRREIAPEARERACRRARNAKGPVMDRSLQRSSGLGAGPPATEAHCEGLVEGLLEHFGPNVHASSVVKIIEVAETDIPVAEANLHHPFAVPPIPRDTGKAGPVGLGHGALTCCA